MPPSAHRTLTPAGDSGSLAGLAVFTPNKVYKCKAVDVASVEPIVFLFNLTIFRAPFSLPAALRRSPIRRCHTIPNRQGHAACRRLFHPECLPLPASRAGLPSDPLASPGTPACSDSPDRPIPPPFSTPAPATRPSSPRFPSTPSGRRGESTWEILLLDTTTLALKATATAPVWPDQDVVERELFPSSGSATAGATDSEVSVSVVRTPVSRSFARSLRLGAS